MNGKWLIFGLGGVVGVWALGNYVRVHGFLDLFAGGFIIFSLLAIGYFGVLAVRSGLNG